MKTFILLFAFIFAGIAAADVKECVTPTPKPKMSVGKPKIRKPTPTPMPSPTPMVMQPIYIKPTPTPCCGEKKRNQNINVNQNQNKTGNQTVVVQVPKQKPIYIKRVYFKTKTKVERVKVFKPNRLQLMLGLSKTKMNVTQDDCCNLHAERVYQPDIGLQYLRDFGGFTGSIMGTMNNSVYLGLGFNW